MRTLKWSIGSFLLLTGSVAFAAPAPGCDKSSRKCHVVVKVVASGGNCTAQISLDPEKVVVRESERNKKYRIVWHLDPGQVFRPALGDGIVIQTDMLGNPDDHDEFGSGQVSDKEDGDASGKARGMHYRLSYFNKVPDRFKYKIQFRDATSGEVHACDPTISNLEAQ